jgi:chemotaxis protein methyltransferase CheR
MTEPVSEIILERLFHLIRLRLGVIVSKNISPRNCRRLEEYIKQRPGGWVSVFSEIEANKCSHDLIEIIDIFVVSHTYFFRENVHFDFFKDTILPTLKDSNVRELRVWSAACSSGEEAYSILLTMLDFYGNDYWFLDAGVLATDISRQGLDRGINGVYGVDSMANIPDWLRKRWFAPNGDYSAIIDPQLRAEITFRWLNLVDPFPGFRRAFHVIFCRNVMLYFDEATRSAVIKKLVQVLAPGGWLIMGQAEDSHAARQWLEPVSGTIYRKVS